MEKIKVIVLWIIAVLVGLVGLSLLITGLVVPGFLWLVATVIVIPVSRVQDTLAKVRIKGAVKAVLVIVILFAGIFSSSTSRTDMIEDTNKSQENDEEIEEQVDSEIPTSASSDDLNVSVIAEQVPEPEPPAPQPEPEPEPIPEPDPEPIPESQQAPDSVTETELEPETQAKSIESTVALIRIALESNFENCNVYMSESGNTLRIDVWRDGLTQAAVLARGGNQELLDSWNDNVVATGIAICKSAQDILDKNGYGNIAVAYSVLNDINLDNIIFSVVGGNVMFDAANGINYIN